MSRGVLKKRKVILFCMVATTIALFFAVVGLGGREEVTTIGDDENASEEVVERPEAVVTVNAEGEERTSTENGVEMAVAHDGRGAIEELNEIEYQDEGETGNEYDLQRLIVRTDRQLDDTYGAAGAIYFESKAGSQYVMQYNSEAETEAAYHNLVNDYGKDKVVVDREIFKVADYPSVAWGNSQTGLYDKKNEWSESGEFGEVNVAVLDTGYNKEHVMFDGRRIVDEYDYVCMIQQQMDCPTAVDDDGHGTHVTGIIADGTPSQVGFLEYKVLDANGNGDTMLVYFAMTDAVKFGANVINMSLGGFIDRTHTDTIGYMQEAVDYAYDNGVLVVVAAGNESVDYDTVRTDFGIPAELDKVVAVSSYGNENFSHSAYNYEPNVYSDGTFYLPYYSNYGLSVVDYAGAGDQVISADYESNDGLTMKSGTSMATPEVTAATAVIKGFNMDATSGEMLNAMKKYAVDIGPAGRDRYFGYGYLDVSNVYRIIAKKSNFTNFVSPRYMSVKNDTYKINPDGGAKVSEHEAGEIMKFVSKINTSEGWCYRTDEDALENKSACILASELGEVELSYNNNLANSIYIIKAGAKKHQIMRDVDEGAFTNAIVRSFPKYVNFLNKKYYFTEHDVNVYGKPTSGILEDDLVVPDAYEEINKPMVIKIGAEKKEFGTNRVTFRAAANTVRTFRARFEIDGVNYYQTESDYRNKNAVFFRESDLEQVEYTELTGNRHYIIKAGAKKRNLYTGVTGASFAQSLERVFVARATISGRTYYITEADMRANEVNRNGYLAEDVAIPDDYEEINEVHTIITGGQKIDYGSGAVKYTAPMDETRVFKAKWTFGTDVYYMTESNYRKRTAEFFASEFIQ